MDDLYTPKPGLGDMTTYLPKAMSVICILMVAEKKTYRKMVDYLNAHHYILSTIVLSKSLSKNIIWRAYGTIPESYLYDIHQKIIRGVQVGPVAGDSIGYSNNGSSR